MLTHLPARSYCEREYAVWIFACQVFYHAIVTICWDILFPVKIIGTVEAAKRLGVTDSRVRKMILAKRLKAIKIGREWLIDPKDLDAVKDRKVGRPRKSRKSAKR